MEARMLLVFVMLLAINLMEVIASSMSGIVNASSFWLIEQQAHKSICQEFQRKALIEFYNEGINKIGHDNFLHGYRGTKNCCLWEGVTCDACGLVVSLKLGDGLSSFNATQAHPSWPIPLGKLKSLEKLEMDSVYFESPLPPAIGLLPQSLVTLSFTNCELLDPVPWTALANLSSLSHLHISGSQFSGLPRYPMPAPGAISISGSRISGRQRLSRLPPQVCNLTNLKHLSLAHHSFKSLLPSCVFSSLLPHLSYLDLSYNSFFGHIPPFWNSSSSLTLLDLSYNHLDGPIAPAFLGHNLQFLHLEGNNLSRLSIPESVPNLTNLLELTMAENQVSGTISQIQWEKLPNWAVLDLGQNQVSGTISEIPWEKLRNLTHLDLSHNQLSGTIPASLIGQLEYSHNRLWGTIPASSGHELRIEHLDLSHNNITGSIPSWIGTSPTSHLLHLDLSYNKFTSFFNISSFNRSMYHLDLSDNLLSGSILPWLNSTRFSSLHTLDLSDNLLHGTIPSCYEPLFYYNMPSEVSFSTNLLSGALSLAGLCSSMPGASFDASSNFFSSLLQDFNSTCTLWSLDLHSNNLKGVMPWNPLFGNDTAGIIIGTLNLANNSLSGEFPQWLGKRTDKETIIENLHLSHNLLSGAIPSYLNTWGLFSLDLSSNFFSGEIPSCICLGSSDFIRLRLADNYISGSIPHELSHCTRLESLVLHNNLLTGFIPVGIISNLSSTLQLLDLAHNHLEGSLPLGLQHMYSLRVLCLQYNSLSGLLPFSLWNTTQLQVLGLSHNQLTGSISAESLSLLQGFWYNSTRNSAVYKTMYEDNIIHAKGRDLHFTYILEATVSMDLSYNNLHGPIPSQLGSLNGLVFLDLSHNQLSGNIPQSLNNLTQLNSLDLSNNNLEGEIPDLCPLTFLEFANVSDNQLNGMIPQCNQWTTYNSSYFLGNKGLCGPQISVSCASSGINKSYPVPDEQQDIEDNDFLLAVIVGVCISFPLCLVITMFWWPVSQPIRSMAKQMVVKFCG